MYVCTCSNHAHTHTLALCRDINVRMYVRTCSNHAHTHVRMVFKDNSMSKMKVGAPQLVHDYKPSEAGI